MSLDHIFAISEFWRLTNLETDFFLLAFEYSKSTNTSLQNYIRPKMEKLVREIEADRSKVYQGPDLKNEDPALSTLYCALWYYPAVHMLTGIQKYQTTEAIAKALKLDTTTIHQALKDLERMGLVHFNPQSKWTRQQNSLHRVTKGSEIQSHLNWRNRGIIAASENLSENLFTTSINTIEVKDLPEMRNKVRAMAAEIREFCLNSGDSCAVAFSLDLFKIV